MHNECVECAVIVALLGAVEAVPGIETWPKGRGKSATLTYNVII